MQFEKASSTLLDERPPPAHVLFELGRLSALRSYHVLGRADLDELDWLAGQAARCIGAPLAAVSFVDERQLWFGGAFGFSRREWARQGSFCEHALVHAGPLVVEDAGADARFRDNELVRGAERVGFYLGVPLQDEDGYRLGTLCVFDRKPRAPEPDGAEELRRLAELASALLAERRASVPQEEPAPERVQGWLGVRTLGWNRRGSQSKPGVIVVKVAAGSPADAAGLRPADVLLAIDGYAVRTPGDIITALSGRTLDELARVQFLRAGHKLERFVPISAAPARRAA